MSDKTEKIYTYYCPFCVNAEGSTGHFFTQDTFEEALEYLNNRSKKISRPDKEQWIEKRVETVTRYEVL